MGQDDTFRITRGTGRVVDCKNVVRSRKARRVGDLGSKFLDSLHRPNLNTMLLGNLVQQGRLGVTIRFTGIERVHGNDNFEPRDSGRDRQESRDMRQRSHDAGELGMSKDVLASVRAQRFVQGHTEERLGGQGDV